VQRRAGRDLMRELGLVAIQPRAYKRTTVPASTRSSRRICSTATSPPAPTAARRVSVWSATSPTSRPARAGSTWHRDRPRDADGRGLADDHPHAYSLIIDALQMAVDAGHVRRDAIFHSDRGTQYTSKEFHQYCKGKHVRPSVGRTGVCWDNAAAESFFASLKTRCITASDSPPEHVPLRRRRLHRSVLQPATAAFHPRYRTRTKPHRLRTAAAAA